MIPVYVLVIAIAIFPGCLGQVPTFDDCPDVQVEQNFNASAYLGKWYEQQKYPLIFELGGKCITAEYSLNDDGSVKVFNSMITEHGHTESIEGSAVVTSTTGEAKLLVTFDMPVTVKSPYWVLETDYSSYSAVWSCYTVFGITTESAWILTREQNPSEEIIKRVQDVFVKNNISVDLLTVTDQISC